MRVVIVGAGPIGLVCGIVLARRGHDVVVVDRDPGPDADGSWERRGVMQFRHPHFFRPNVRAVLAVIAPDLWEAVVAAGGVPVRPPGAPDGVAGLQCRRSTFETAIRRVAARQDGLVVRHGHATGPIVERGRVRGVRVDGGVVDAELLIDATGRAGRFGDDMRPPGDGGPCGFAYVSRMYRQRDGVHDLDETTTPIAQVYQGYMAIVFPQDAGTLSALIVRQADDDALALVRRPNCFDAAARIIPLLARWTDPRRFEPISPVMPGGGLTNTYRPQADTIGYLSVGDAVCTTNPAAGRGISLGLQQAAVMLELFERSGLDIAAPFQRWCDDNIKPWFEDHSYWDATLLRRFRGHDIDIEARIPSDVICAAAQIDRSVAPSAAQYLAMSALPQHPRPNARQSSRPPANRMASVICRRTEPQPAQSRNRS